MVKKRKEMDISACEKKWNAKKKIQNKKKTNARPELSYFQA